MKWWPWTRRDDELVAALKRTAELEREKADVLANLTTMREHFDRLVIIEPRVRAGKGRAVTLAIPDPVLVELRKAGPHLASRFAEEVARRLVFRALRELWDIPVEIISAKPKH